MIRCDYPVSLFFTKKKVIDFLKYYNLGKNNSYSFFKNESVLLNGTICKENSIIQEESTISLLLDETIDFIPDKSKIKVLYEDSYFLIINKPANILVHPDSKLKNGTLVNRVAYYYFCNNINLHIRYLHRLDFETSGIILFAKDPLTQAFMNKQIEKHIVRRTYLALCSGYFKEKKGIIDAKIGEDRHHNQRKRVSKTGKDAITHYEIVKQYEGFALVKCILETGRTHQIRVHMAHIGHPLLGDILYGGESSMISRVALHSFNVLFQHPFLNKEVNITLDLPYDMSKIIKER